MDRMNRMKNEIQPNSKFIILFLILNIVFAPIVMFSLVVATDRYHAFGTILLIFLVCTDLFGVCYQLVTRKR